MSPLTHGSFPLTGVAGLPNVTVAHGPAASGDHWSDLKASEVITPGEAVVKASGAWRIAEAGDTGKEIAIALRCVDIPDENLGFGSRGPNETVNLPIQVGEYVHAYYQGAFNLTLVVPDEYAIGDLIGWDADGVRPDGKAGSGAWAKNAAADLDSIFEVMKWRPVNSDDEGILTVRRTRLA